MKLIMIIMFLFTAPILLLRGKTIEFRYPSTNIKKTSTDGGLTWKTEHIFGPIIKIKRLNEALKISYDFGKTWSRLEEEGQQQQDIHKFSKIISNNETKLTFDIIENSSFEIVIFDINGNEVRNVLYKKKTRNSTKVELSISSLENGYYLVFLKNRINMSYKGKFILLK